MHCPPKVTAFWITIAAYAAIHALRMCYSFNKVNLRRQFNLSEFYLGFLDAVLYISYALGVLIRYQIFEGNSNMKKVYFITSIIVSVCFGFVAYLAIST
jgi:sugar phosphate permease